jgi:hypothetical protein
MRKKIKSNIVLYISDQNIKKSMELKSGLELLNIEYDQRTTPEKMPFVVFDGNRESFSMSKSIIYERVRINERQINRVKRRWMKRMGVMIAERKLNLWQRIKAAFRRGRKLLNDSGKLKGTVAKNKSGW